MPALPTPPPCDSPALAVQRGRLFVVAAPSGAGKTSLMKALIASEAGVEVAVSHTTRQRRAGEEDGVNYHFVDPAGFRQMVETGDFLEWAEVFGHLYGTSRAAVETALAAGKRLFLEIDWQGAQQIRQRLPEALTIFILPPSRQALRERLLARGQDGPAAVARRTAEALEELSHFDEFDYLIVNDNFEQALAQLRQLVGGEGEALATGKRLGELAPLIKSLTAASA